jgi:alanyl-tRNA synthetase
MSTVHHEPQKTTMASIEASFLDFFHQRGYTSLPGSPLLDESIKMSFVMSAGLVQVERALQLTGQPLKRRFALVQSCFRHFDMMEGFGASPDHLSLFRMAGAFCFGRLERRARIAEVWDLLSTVYGLGMESLWITYFTGGCVWEHPFDLDTETFQSWMDIGIPAKRIVASEENFWKQSPLMGTSKEYPHLKCGPNCEIFFDRGEMFACGLACRPGCRCGRFVEFLNILFIGWEQDPDDNQIRPLADPFVEVVVGVERLAMILQGANSVYEIESFPLLLDVLEELSGKNTVQGEDRESQMRLLADHLRSMLFLVADGAPRPGHGGRARIMRRLARNLLTSQIILDLPRSRETLLSPAIPQMLDILLDFYRTEHPFPGRPAPRMLEAHPCLVSTPEKLLEFLETEASLFEKTIRRGLHTLDKLINRHPTRYLSGSEMLALVVSEGLPEAYLTWVLDQKQIHYSWEEYLLERRQWQAATKS